MSRQSEAEIREELSSSAAAIEEADGKKVELFRPPYGDYDNLLVDTAKAMGLYTVQWDVDSLDWKDLSATDIAMRIINGVKPGVHHSLPQQRAAHGGGAAPHLFHAAKPRL